MSAYDHGPDNMANSARGCLANKQAPGDLTLGDYVFASKFPDCDWNDPSAVGFVRELGVTYVIVGEANGSDIPGVGNRHWRNAMRITQEQGHRIVHELQVKEGSPFDGVEAQWVVFGARDQPPRSGEGDIPESTLKVQHLKTWPQYFEAVKRGSKTFEIRGNDRPYVIGQILVLHEFDPETSTYSGRMVEKVITYITDWEQKPGYVVLAIAPVSYPPVTPEGASPDYQDEMNRLLDDLTAAQARENSLRDFISKMDGIIEEVGGVTASCINPYEDLKGALLGQKGKADSFEKKFTDAQAEISGLKSHFELVRDDRNRAVAYAKRIERGEVKFTSLAQKELEKILTLGLEKDINEGLGDAVVRTVSDLKAEIGRLRGALEYAKGFLAAAPDTTKQ